MQKEDQIAIRKHERNPDDGELDITPMIDVTFLLLAFFVVVSKMDPQASVKLPEASMSFSIPDKNCVVLIVTAGDDIESFSVFNSGSMDAASQIPSDDPDVLEESVGDFVESELSLFPTKTAILIKAEGDVRTGVIEMVKRGIARSGLAEDKEIHIAVEEK